MTLFDDIKQHRHSFLGLSAAGHPWIERYMQAMIEQERREGRPVIGLA